MFIFCYFAICKKTHYQWQNPERSGKYKHRASGFLSKKKEKKSAFSGKKAQKTASRQKSENKTAFRQKSAKKQFLG